MDFIPQDSLNPTDYKWSLTKGADGKSPIVKISEDGQSILVSSDNGETWYPLVPDFNKIRILGYVDSVAQLPRSADVGDIYGVWNPDANEGEGAYEMYINTVTGWAFDANILKVYEYETELPASAADGTVAVIPQKNMTLDKEKIDGYKVYKYSLANRGWTMILNTSEIFASKDDIINHGDNLYALVQGDVQNIPDVISNWTNGTLDENENFKADTKSIIGTCALNPNIKVLKYNIASGYTVDIRVISNEQFNPNEIQSPNVLSGTEGAVEGSGKVIVPEGANSLIAIITRVDASEEDLPVSTGSYLSLYHEVVTTYQLYKRVVGWVFFGTNASITYHLVQNIEEGTETNVLSGKAVKDAFNELEEEVDTRLDNLERNTLALTLTVAPNKVFYKDIAENITITAALGDLDPDVLDIKKNGIKINEGTQKTVIYTEALAESTNIFTANASYYDARFAQQLSISSRYPVYTIFTTLDADLTTLVSSMKRESARVSATGTYDFNNNTGALAYPYLLVPSDVALPSRFSMGGTPVAYVTSSITLSGVSYTVYRLGSDAGYEAGVTLSITAS